MQVGSRRNTQPGPEMWKLHTHRPPLAFIVVGRRALSHREVEDFTLIHTAGSVVAEARSRTDLTPYIGSNF